MGIPLFVYGTLCDEELRQEVLGRALPTVWVVPAKAPGFRVVHYPGRIYPALVPATGAMADGLLLTNLTDRDLSRLDAYEGDEYCRTPIVVKASAGPLTALAYLPTLPIAAESPLWRLDEWQARHKPAALAERRAHRRGPGQRPLSP